jgi:hypothetical protein
MMPHERRVDTRKPLEHLVHLSLPFENSGIVLDVSEGGLGFCALAPVEADGPIHFRFAIDSATSIDGVGELAWKDGTRKNGGLRFTQLSEEDRERIRLWTSQPSSRARASSLLIPVDMPALGSVVIPGEGSSDGLASVGAGNPLVYSSKPPVYRAPFTKLSKLPFKLSAKARATAAVVSQIAQLLDEVRVQVRAWVAQSKTGAYDDPFADLAFKADVMPRSEMDLTALVDVPTAAPAIEAEAVTSGNGERTSVVATGTGLLYNLKPPLYSAPFNKLSMFPQEMNSDGGVSAAVVTQIGELLDGVRGQIGDWAAQSKTGVYDDPFADPTFEAGVARGSGVDLAAIADIPVAGPALQIEPAAGGEADVTPVVATANSVLSDSKRPVYSAPFGKRPMFPLDLDSDAAATDVAEPRHVLTRHPIAAIALTIVVALLVSIAIFSYVSTTRAGQLFFEWGEKMLGGNYSQAMPRKPAPPASSAPNGSNSPQR